MKSITLKLLILVCFLINQQISFSQSFQWAKQFGDSTSFSVGYSVIVNKSNQVLSTGNFTGVNDFDPGSSNYNLTSMGYEDIYISKLDNMGNFIWAKQFGGSGHQLCFTVDNDKSNNIYTTGVFEGCVDFDPSLSTYNLCNNFWSSTQVWNTFISKLDSNGNFIWAKSFEGTGSNGSAAMHIDYAGNVITVGSFDSITDFDPGVGIYYLVPDSPGYSNIYISKLDSNGNFIWAKKIGNADIGNRNVLAIDSLNNILISGSFNGIVDFDPNSGIYNLTTNGSNNVFVLKLDSNGDFAWVKAINPTAGSNSYSISIALNKDGKILYTGQFAGTVDFDSSPSIFNLNSISNSNDIFISMLDSDGKFLWAKSIGNAIQNEQYSSTFDSLGNVYLVGDLKGTIDFDPGINTFNLTSNASYNDMFILKLDTLGNFVWVKQLKGTSIGSIVSITLDPQQNIYTTGFFSGIVDFNTEGGIFNLSASSVSSFVEKISQCQGSFDTLNIKACYSYFFNTQTLTNSGIYHDTLQNTIGCDSLIELHLTINNSTSSTQNISACNSYFFNNQTLTNSGIYYDTLQNANGCDSLIELNLTINSIINNNIIQNNDTLSSSITNANYQWISCNPYQIIPNEINPKYIAISNGIYAVVISQNGCIDTSYCFNFTTLGFGNSVENDNSTKLFPNPVNSILFIENANDIEKKLFNSIGQLIIYTKENEIDVSRLHKGLYYLKVENETKKVIVE